MDLVNDERGRLGQGRTAAPAAAQEPALLTGQERVGAATNRAKAGFFDRNWIGPLEGRHVVIFPDRHVLVKVADQRVPPADHPPAGRAEERKPRLLDQPVVGRTLVGLDPNPPLAVNPSRVNTRSRIRCAGRSSPARCQRKDRQHQQKPRCSPDY